ncbi:endonuclease/exonuclease/phosphatase family protein [Allomuricauda sp. SCSIO 65647]|uniref:endonuclease/exonuclease/phosphatase family protein n=1 Tax=Allomuricauda sp. SCSIO 65647 TaxID=2908843 RepID=UPI001F33FC10|nr:endonuclease/exonuclease/phosphatase family protein [Muricauda sp. SCSIO 65647]UJH68388.1 endonuclease/exonuclease/phosphatase family protein [Muricauda sp. SCSIO 65647]
MKKLLLLLLCGVFHTNAQTKVDSTRIVRVLSFNIYHGETVGADKKFDLDLLASIINNEAPDLVALQEVDFKTKRALGYDLATELGQRTKMAPLFGKAMPYNGGEYGEGVLSKYSFLHTKNHALAAGEGKEPRAALEVNVQLKSGDPIRFIGTHLDHTRDETDRINQAKQLNELFATNDIPTILAGDLNARPDSETMGILFKQWQRSDAENTPTAPASDPRAKIDYVLFRPANKWCVLETKVLCNEKATDHCVVLSVLQLLD